MTGTDTRQAPPRPRMFALLGTGVLCDAVAGALAPLGACVCSEGLVGDAEVALVVTDSWTTAHYPSIRATCAERGIPWLPVRAELGRVVIGPVELAGVPGCARCFEMRRGRARADAKAYAAVLERHRRALERRPSSWLTALGCDTVATLVADEVARLPEDTRIHNGVWYVDLDDLTTTRHRFLPEPLCPECGDLPGDSPGSALVTLRPRRKITPTTYRIRRVLDELDELTDIFVDAESGLIRSLHRNNEGGLAVAVASMPSRTDDRIESGAGRTRTYRTSELIGILEAIERWGGMQPGGKRTVVTGSYRELPGPALDPRELGVHTPEDYARPGFPFRPFDESQVCHWVWGHSFARQEPILVPETCAYYRTPRAAPQQRPFVYEISNGCALGSCLEEAILYGLLEVAERDAFLMTWYAEMPVPRLDLHSARDRAIPLQAAAISAETGYRVSVFDTTTETGIPCVWAMAVAPEDTEELPKVLCAAGSHLDPERAVLNSLSELGPLLGHFIRRFPAETETARRMVGEPALVTTMHDHSLLYGAQESFGRLDFLSGSPRQQDLAETADRCVGFRGADLSEDLAEALRRHLEHGMDVIVVDQTTAEHRAGGFHCVKVLVPGAVPMTFGHAYRRTDGLPRLLRIPHQLGHRSRPLRREDLNPHPHPFP
jgi:ribosomal protein S12 methylthiotransferase accessory factor